MIRFGTSGWRAIISDEFTFGNVRLVTQAIANVLNAERPDRSVVIGYDTRFLSEKVAAECAAVLSTNRVRAFLCGRDAPTPAVSLEIATRRADAGIYFTASHNPPEYNGLKYYTADGAPAPTAVTDRIELEILRLSNAGFDRRYIAEPRFITGIDPQEPYLKHLLQSVDVERIRTAGLRLGLDPLFGTTRDYLDRVLIENECAIEVIHNFADPYFGGYSPNCSENNLRDLRKLVLDTGCDLGLATDGDGDRFGILAADGSYVSAGDVLPLLLDYLVTERGFRGGFARTVATSHLLDRVARKHGIDVVETPVGFKYIAERLVRGVVDLGGEESAGFTLRSHLPEKDGVLACLLVAEMLATRRVPLAEARAALWAEHGAHHQRRLTFEMTPEHEAALDAALDAPPRELAGLPVAGASRIDGLKLMLRDGSWCLVRRSGTEPVLRVYAESRSEVEVERLIAGVRALVAGTH